MAIDTYIFYAGVYPDLDSAEADYALVKELFSKEDLEEIREAKRETAAVIGTR